MRIPDAVVFGVLGSVAQHRVIAWHAGVRYIRAEPLLEVLKITEEKLQPLSLHVRMVRFSFMVFKDYKPEVPSHNSFESQLCRTLNNPHTIRK